MTTSNTRGAAFEGEARRLLNELTNTHPSVVAVAEKPNVELQNGEVVIPDFHLRIEYSAETRNYFIECQDRTHYTHSILHKVQHVRTKQAFKTFIFVYRDGISGELARAMDAEGVVHQSLEEFQAFLSQVSCQLASQPKRPEGYKAPVYAGIDGNELLVALAHASDRLRAARAKSRQHASIAIALYFIEAIEDARGGKSGNLIRLLREMDRLRINPFASYYFGWFDYINGVFLDDEPTFFQRGFRVERGAWRRDFANFQPTGYDLILCDVRHDERTHRLALSSAIHLKLGELGRAGLPLHDVLMDLPRKLTDQASEDAQIVEGGLMACHGSAVATVQRYLTERGQSGGPACERLEAEDRDILPGDFGGQIEV